MTTKDNRAQGRIDLAQFKGHTPGPWMVSRLPDVHGRECVNANGPINVALLSRYGVAEEQGQVDANAALIAEAPALLAALEQAYGEIDEGIAREIAMEREVREALEIADLDSIGESMVETIEALKADRDTLAEALNRIRIMTSNLDFDGPSDRMMGVVNIYAEAHYALERVGQGGA